MTPYTSEFKYQHFNSPGEAHELTFTCFHRKRFLKSRMPKEILSDAINLAAARLDFHVWAYVFMPEHIHIIIFPCVESYSVSQILKTIKQSSSRRIINFLKANKPSALRNLETGLKDPKYRFWQDGGGYDRNYWTTSEILKQVTYIHENPVVEGLCENAVEWEWSSARFWETGEKGPVVVNLEHFQ